MLSSLNAAPPSALLPAALAALLTACGGSGDSEDLESAVAVGRLDTVSIYISSEEGKLIFEPGETWQFYAISVDSQGREKVIEDTVSWNTSDEQLATVNGKGLVSMGEPAGSRDVNVQSQFGEYTAAQTITVSNAELTGVAIAPADDPLPECQSTPFSATGTYSDGTERPLASSLTWSTDEPDLATFDENTLLSHDSGLVNAQAETSDGVSGEYPLTMTDTLTAITVSSGGTLSLFVGDQVTLSASGDYSDASTDVDITENSSWSIDDPEVATLEQETITAVALGSTELTVQCGGLSELVTVDVIEFDDIVIVDPEPDLELVEGETRQMELYKTYSNEDVDTEDIADQANWSIVAGQSVANIDEDGELTMSNNFSGYNADEIRIEAEYQDFTDEIELPISN